MYKQNTIEVVNQTVFESLSVMISLSRDEEHREAETEAISTTEEITRRERTKVFGQSRWQALIVSFICILQLALPCLVWRPTNSSLPHHLGKPTRKQGNREFVGELHEALMGTEHVCYALVEVFKKRISDSMSRSNLVQPFCGSPAP